MAFQVGDVVELKTGGREMMVSYAHSDDRVTCEWTEIGQSGQPGLVEGAFATSELKLKQSASRFKDFQVPE